MKRCPVYFAVFFTLFLAWLALPASAQEITGGQNMTGLADQLLSPDKFVRQAASQELGRRWGEMENRLLANFDALLRQQGPGLHTFDGPFDLTIGQLGYWRVSDAAGRLVQIIEFPLDPATAASGAFYDTTSYYPAVRALEEIGGERVVQGLFGPLSLPANETRLRATAEVLRHILGQEDAKALVERKRTDLRARLKRLGLSSVPEDENLKAIAHFLDEKGDVLKYPKAPTVKGSDKTG